MSWESIKEDRWKIEINLGTVLYLAALWTYMVFQSARPFDIPVFLHVGIIGALMVAIYHFCTKHVLSFMISGLDLAVASSYLVIMAILNAPILGNSINNDELAFSETSQVFIRMIDWLIATGSVSENGLIMKTPVNELKYYFAALYIVFLLLLTVVWRSVRRLFGRKVFYGFLWGLALVLGVAFYAIPSRVTSHPALFYFPLTLSSSLFGMNDFAFRLPGLFVFAGLSFFTYRLIVRKHGDGSRFYAYVIAFCLLMLPTVFHISVVVTTTIWSFMGWILCIYMIYLAHDTDDFKYLVYAGGILALLNLARFQLIVVWPMIPLAVLAHKEFRKHFFRNSFAACFPFFLVLPYYYTISVVGYPVTDDGPLANVWLSITSGVGVRAIMKTTGPLWIVAGLALLPYVLLVNKNRVKFFYLAAIPAYILFFSIQPWLFGVGRYQAEYIGPFLVLTFFLAALSVRGKGRAMLTGGLLFLSAYSVHANRTMHQDVYYDQWPRKRITAESYFPFKDALGYLHRQQAGGNFIMLSRAAAYGEIKLWMRGYVLAESRLWAANQDKFREFSSHLSQVALAEFFEFLKKNEIKYFVIQFGERTDFEREWNRPRLHSLIAQLSYYYNMHRGKAVDFSHQHTFYGKHEGAFDIYGPTTERYGLYRMSAGPESGDSAK